MGDVTEPQIGFEAVVGSLGLDGTGERWRRDWDRSAHEPVSEPLASEAGLRRWCRWAAWSPDITEALAGARRALWGSPVLLRLLKHFQWMMFQGTEREAMIWPELPGALGELSTLFYPLVHLAALPRMRAMYRQRRIPATVARATLADLELWMRDHYRQRGTWGLPKAWWLAYHVTGRVYAMGRLQFEFHHYKLPFRFFRHVQTGRVVALANDGCRFRTDGQFENSEGTRPGEAVWVARYGESDAEIVGHAVSERGVAVPDEVRLDRRQWRLALEPGDPVLAVHIPASGPMDHEACGRAFAQAAQFFPRHFPDQPFRAFLCVTWLLDPQLADRLPPRANLVRFLRRYHLVPLERTRAAYTYERVFGNPTPDWDTAPQDTLLRRVMVQHVRAGGTWRSAGGVIFPDEVSSQ